MGHIITRANGHIKTTPITLDEYLMNEMAENDNMLVAKDLMNS